MKKIQLLLPALLVLLMASCAGPATDDKGTDTIVNGDTLAKSAQTPSAENQAATSSLCFIRTENRDTTNVELVKKGNDVTGQMSWLPFEKDSRKGTLNGTLKGDTVYAVWSFMQEGMKDTLGLQFLIKEDGLMQKPLKLNTKTGREQTDNAAGYTITYRPSVTLKH